MSTIVYNVTVKVENSIEQEWFEWMKNEHIPRVLDTKCFSDNIIMKLRYPADDDGATYAIQYMSPSMAELDRYHSDFAAKLRDEHQSRYGSNVVSFRTILEVLD